jgi:DNA-binding response OmpR family regulator
LLPEREEHELSTATARVMTVEDDPIVRADLRLVLEDAGFGVCADARDGVEAVELARLHTPDLIVLDLGLPRLDGVEATRQILGERDVPIIALTGRSTSLAMEAMDAGAVTWLRKPFVERELVDTVTAALATHLQKVRDESRATLASILELVGYPADWADDLERRAFDTGHIWKRAR